MSTKTCLLRVCDILDVCYHLYDMICLLYVFYIELELYLSGGLKNITLVRASSLFMYFIPNWLRLSEAFLPIQWLI